MGLAWTPTGGELLFIEAIKMPGCGRLELTGKLGDVMKESARAALSWIRSNLNIRAESLASSDIHIHFPAGAIPKDGPSAGCAIVSALASLFQNTLVRDDTCMTGEITLHGNVLPVGGSKEKLLAAHREGLQRVVIPKRNERNLDDLPDDVRSSLAIFPVATVADLLQLVLHPPVEEGNIAMPHPSSSSSSSSSTYELRANL